MVRPEPELCDDESEEEKGPTSEQEDEEDLENDEDFNKQVQQAVQAISVERPTKKASLWSRLAHYPMIAIGVFALNLVTRSTHHNCDSPAIVTDHEIGALRRMMKMVDQANAGRSSEPPPQVLEINPSHPINRQLSAASVNTAAPRRQAYCGARRRAAV